MHNAEDLLLHVFYLVGLSHFKLFLINLLSTLSLSALHNLSGTCSYIERSSGAK